MIYPESLKFLPLYGLALSKSTPLRGGYGDVQLDERSAAGFTMMALPIKKLLKLLYPNLIRLDDLLPKVSVLQLEFSSLISCELFLKQILQIASQILKSMNLTSPR